MSGTRRNQPERVEFQVGKEGKFQTETRENARALGVGGVSTGRSSAGSEKKWAAFCQCLKGEGGERRGQEMVQCTGWLHRTIHSLLLKH